MWCSGGIIVRPNTSPPFQWDGWGRKGTGRFWIWGEKSIGLSIGFRDPQLRFNNTTSSNHILLRVNRYGIGEIVLYGTMRRRRTIMIIIFQACRPPLRFASRPHGPGRRRLSDGRAGSADLYLYVCICVSVYVPCLYILWVSSLVSLRVFLVSKQPPSLAPPLYEELKTHRPAHTFL